MARCDYCGREYDESAYQVVIQTTRGASEGARSFDTVECAIRSSAAGDGPSRAPANAGDETTLARLEQAAAELFMARAELVEERRRREDLEQRAKELAGERDRLAAALAGHPRALAHGTLA